MPNSVTQTTCGRASTSRKSTVARRRPRSSVTTRRTGCDRGHESVGELTRAFCSRIVRVSSDPPTRDDVVRAAETIRGRVRRTPLLDGSALAPRLALKAELLQHTGSFKARGVTNRLAALSADERARGVAGASAGNHAIALAWGAAAEGLDCVVFCWDAASPFKLDRARALGARIDAEAEDPSGAFTRLEEHLAETGATLVHPFDDPLVMAGQGTVGLEILEDAPADGRGRRPRRRRRSRRRGSPRRLRLAAFASSASSPRARPRSCWALEAGEPVAVAPRDDRRAASTRRSPAPSRSRSAAGAGVERRDASRTSRSRTRCGASTRDAKLACEPAGAAAVAAVLAGLVEGRFDRRRRLGRQRRARNRLCYPGRSMKADIHPEYVVAHVTCSCGNEFMTRSTKAELHVEVCSALPSVLHGQAEADGLGWPGRALPAPPREGRRRQVRLADRGSPPMVGTVPT